LSAGERDLADAVRLAGGLQAGSLSTQVGVQAFGFSPEAGSNEVVMSMARGKSSGWMKSQKRLARIIALAMLMVGVSVLPGQATQISLEFTSSQTFNDYEFSYDPPGPTPVYGYSVRISFAEGVNNNFFLTVEDNAVSSPTVPLPSTPHWAGWKCADIAPSSPQCVEYLVTGGTPSLPAPMPVQGIDYDGDIDIFVSFGLYGWPAFGIDPIVLGDIDSFSSLFMVFGNRDFLDLDNPLYPLKFRLGYLPSTGTDPDDWNDITVTNCPGDDFDFCIASVPEPATIGGVVWGLLGLTVLSRRMRRRI
jgi:hypothetical protein